MGKCIPDHISRVSRHGGPYSDRERLGQTLVNTWSKLPEFWEMRPGPCSEVILCDKPLSDQADLVRAALFCVPTPEKIQREKIGYDMRP